MSSPSPSTEQRLITGEELARMGDVGRCELIDGGIVRMSPTGYRHGDLEARFTEVLRAFVRPRGLGRVQSGEVGIYTRRDPDRVRGADVLFISKERFAGRTRGLAYLDVPPELVVEVLSPDDRAMEVTQKLREYFAIGVKRVWVADPEAAVVSAYRSLTDVREFGCSATLPGDDVLPGFAAQVASLFEE